MISSKDEKIMLQIENKFKQVSGLDLDLSVFPMQNNTASQVVTNKDKSKKFGEVFTPLWLVDEMIGQVKFENCHSSTLDLCAGFGQFSIRLMRYYANTFEDFNLVSFVKNNHYFVEMQLASCYKLISIFDINLNLFIGDASKLPLLPKAAKGIWIYLEAYNGWVSLTKTVKNILCPNGVRKPRVSEQEFVSEMEKLILILNGEYHKMAVTFQDMMRDKLSRLTLLSALNNTTKDTSIQGVDTPEIIVKELVDCVDDLEHKTIAVLFNTEIIEYLVYSKKLDRSKITYMADYGSRLEAEYVKAMYGVETILFNKDMALLRAQLGVKRFDVAFSNPPYNDNVHLKILSSLIGSGNGSSIAKEYVVVHPANWLIDLKGKENLFINFKNLISNKLNSVKIFNGNIVFGIGLFYPCVITHVDNDHSGNIGVDYFGDKYTVDSIYRITKYGKDWDTYVSSFYGKVKSFIKDNSSVWDHNKKVLTSDKEYCQLAGIRGNVSKDPQKVCGDDFYTLVMQNSETNKGVRKVSEKDKMPVFEFNSVLERDNFISYLKTDFARFCLAFYKVNQHTDRGEMEIIPWIDFTQEWDDEKLFNHFDINKETQDYIRKFLPDYYGIRK